MVVEQMELMCHSRNQENTTLNRMVSSYNIGRIIIRDWDWARGLYPSCALPQVPSLGLLQLQEPKAQGWQCVQSAAGIPTHTTRCGWTQDTQCFLHLWGQTPFNENCHSAAPIHMWRWWHFQWRKNPQCHNTYEKEDLLCGCIFSVGKPVWDHICWAWMSARAIQSWGGRLSRCRKLFFLGVLQSWLTSCPCSSLPVIAKSLCWQQRCELQSTWGLVSHGSCRWRCSIWFAARVLLGI